MGTVAPATGEVIVEEYEESTADTFHQFLQVVLHRYPGKPIYLILDNANIHQAKVLSPFLADHPALHLLFLPPYYPNLNNVERLWKWLREKVILNTYFPELAAIKNAIRRFSFSESPNGNSFTPLPTTGRSQEKLSAIYIAQDDNESCC